MPTASANDASARLDPATTATATPMAPGTSDASPEASDSSSTGAHWKPTGRCGYCLLPIETDQRAPSSATTRHTADKVPYFECAPAQRMPTRIPRGGDIEEMRPVDAELIAKLDHYGIDPRQHRHWRLVRETTGGSHRVFDPIYPGEQ